MASRQDVDAVVQSLQKVHASLPPGQQRILEWCLDCAQSNANTPGSSSGPDVTGYSAPSSSGWSKEKWATAGNWAWSWWGKQK
jgi:hypothetical protein